MFDRGLCSSASQVRKGGSDWPTIERIAVTSHTPISITSRKQGRHWALRADNHLLALTVYRKGARTLAVLLEQLLSSTDEEAFRQALGKALAGTAPDRNAKEASQRGQR